MTLHEKIMIAIWSFIGLCVIILLFYLFRKSPITIDNFQKLIDAKEETIKAIQQQRVTDSLLIVEKDKNIQLSDQRDSALQVVDATLQRRYSQNKTQHQTNQKAYDKIPIDIRTLSADSLQRAISDYYK